MSEDRAGLRAEPPQPPTPPLPGDCCGGGCLNCVFDLYDQALERYQLALAEWESRCQPSS